MPMPSPRLWSSPRTSPAPWTPTRSPAPPTTAWPTATSASTCARSSARRSPRRAGGGSSRPGDAAGPGGGRGPRGPRQALSNDADPGRVVNLAWSVWFNTAADCDDPTCCLSCNPLYGHPDAAAYAAAQMGPGGGRRGHLGWARRLLPSPPEHAAGPGVAAAAGFAIGREAEGPWHAERYAITCWRAWRPRQAEDVRLLPLGSAAITLSGRRGYRGLLGPRRSRITRENRGPHGAQPLACDLTLPRRLRWSSCL
jgi:hypothetical protein